MPDNDYSEVEESAHNIMGYGKIINVLFGTKKKSDSEEVEADVRAIHLTPVGMKDVSTVQKNITELINEVKLGNWSEAAIQKATDIIYMSTRRMHPELTKEQIMDHFSLSILGKALTIVLDINHFLSQMQQLQKTQQQVIPMLEKK